MRSGRANVWAEDYVLFDCPGQVELYTHHESLRNIFYRIQKLGYRVWFPTLSLLKTHIRMMVLTGFAPSRW